ncbi:SDR family oxidoreductase [Rhodocyclus purpureus]|uniref:SDR family oxidoreductase n=1 Tax=Rhodocyclus purpureus TaxID=1067 RepID=UPI0019113B70|nr:SDR family oxidoreductase [Rhodocyclus purpureus]MBK5914447.1 short-chain dehydrogenase [Rhodocyclus purpureus]
MQKILVIGATSAIAEATCRRWAARGDALFLVARDAARLEAIAADLSVRGAAAVGSFAMDATDFAAHAAMFAAAQAALGRIDVALIAHGTLPEQKACEASVEETLAAIEVNGTSVIALATRIGAQLEAQNSGVLAVIGSVAGDRGRASNYVYGAAKGMVDIFMQGMRHRLAKSGAQALIIKPGFVDTPMTASFSKGALWAKPDDIARGIVKAVDQRRDQVYLPGFWRFIMLVIRHIPQAIFKKTSL